MRNQIRFDDPDDVRKSDFIEQVKAALGLPHDTQLELQGIVLNSQGERIVTYSAKIEIKLESVELGEADGVVMDQWMMVSLRFDARGGLVSSHAGSLDESRVRQAREQIRRLLAADEIYVPAPGEKIDPTILRAQHKPWYIAIDEQGRKRLRRAYIS